MDAWLRRCNTCTYPGWLRQVIRWDLRQIWLYTYYTSTWRNEKKIYYKRLHFRISHTAAYATCMNFVIKIKIQRGHHCAHVTPYVNHVDHSLFPIKDGEQFLIDFLLVPFLPNVTLRFSNKPCYSGVWVSWKAGAMQLCNTRVNMV